MPNKIGFAGPEAFVKQRFSLKLDLCRILANMDLSIRVPSPIRLNANKQLVERRGKPLQAIAMGDDDPFNALQPVDDLARITMRDQY
jgi:hypothetical protein